VSGEQCSEVAEVPASRSHLRIAGPAPDGFVQSRRDQAVSMATLDVSDAADLARRAALERVLARLVASAKLD
jgi:hypothetical protein